MPAAEDGLEAGRRWRFHHSLAAKVGLLAAIFLAVPIIVYDQFRAADEAAAGAVVVVDEIQRELEFALPARLLQHPDQSAVPAGDPPAAVEARAQISARAQFGDLLQQRFLHAALAAELHEGRDAVAEQFGDRETRVHREVFGN